MKKYTSILVLIISMLTVSVSADSRDSRITAVSTPSSLTPYGKGQLYDMAEEYFDACEYDMANTLYSKLQDNPEVIKRLDVIGQEKQQQIYDVAEQAVEDEDFELAIKLFSKIHNYADSNVRIAECEDALERKKIELAIVIVLAIMCIVFTFTRKVPSPMDRNSLIIVKRKMK